MSVESMEMRIDCTGAADNLWFGDVFSTAAPHHCLQRLNTLLMKLLNNDYDASNLLSSSSKCANCNVVIVFYSLPLSTRRFDCCLDFSLFWFVVCFVSKKVRKVSSSSIPLIMS
jgi:hypothetical protein